jgi:hypothetical protein
MSVTLFPLQYQRQSAVPVDVDSVFLTTAARTAYLTSPRRYAGQVASDLEAEKVFMLNAAMDAWRELVQSTGITSVNSQAGPIVTLTAADVGADASGAATSAVAAHVALADPHPLYTTASEAAAAAPVQSVAGRTGNVTISATDVGGLTEASQDATAALLGAGTHTGITVTYDDAGNSLSLSVAPSSSSVNSVNSQTGTVVLTASDVGADASGAATSAVAAHVALADPHPLYTTASEAAAAAPVQSVAGRTGSVTLAATDISGLAEASQDAVAAMIAAGTHTGLTASYDDAANSLSLTVTGGSGAVNSVNGQTGVVVLTAANVGADASGAATDAVAAHVALADPHPLYTTASEAAAAAPVQSVAGRTGAVVITSADLADFAEASQDSVAAMIAAGTHTGLTASYNDAANSLSFTVTGGSGGVTSVAGKTGVVTLTASDVGADASGAATSAVAAHVALADPHPLYTTASEAAAAAPVQSVAGRTGTVVVTSADLADFTEAAQDAVAAALTNGVHTGVTVAYDDANNRINLTATGGGGGGGTTTVYATGISATQAIMYAIIFGGG